MQKQKRFYIEVDLFLRGKRKKPSVAVGFIPRDKDGSYSKEEHGLRNEDSEAWNKVDTALREFALYLKSVGELD